MSPLEYIEEGIRQGNWETVCEGYERLTGKALPLPEVHQAQEALQKIIVIAQKIVGCVGEFPQTEIISHSSYPPLLGSEDKPPIIPKKRDRPKNNRKKKIKQKIRDGEDTTLILDGQINTPVTQEFCGTQLITNDPSSKEIEANKIKAAKAEQNKVKLNRQIPHRFDVTCNECEETFKSDRPDGELGQKCSRCLKEKRNRLT